MSDNILETVSHITEFNDIREFMKDPELDQALDMVIKLMVKPDVPPATASIMIIKLQSMAAKFAILARYYTTLQKGEDSSKKKNVYYTISEEIDKLVAALKYGAK
jgi:hypothetical protein